jgi:hypothetical protein
LDLDEPAALAQTRPVDLRQLGWTDDLAAPLAAAQAQARADGFEVAPARVIAEHRGAYHLLDERDGGPGGPASCAWPPARRSSRRSSPPTSTRS